MLLFVVAIGYSQKKKNGILYVEQPAHEIVDQLQQGWIYISNKVLDAKYNSIAYVIKEGFLPSLLIIKLVKKLSFLP